MSTLSNPLLNEVIEAYNSLTLIFISLPNLFPRAENPLKFAAFFCLLANYFPPFASSSALTDLTSIPLSCFSWIQKYWWCYLRRMTDVLHKGLYVGEAWRCANQSIIFTVQWSACGIFWKHFQGTRHQRLHSCFALTFDLTWYQ